MNEDIVIWGSGEFGNIAYHYYKEKGNILCYVDSDSKRWDSTLNGLKICSPDILYNTKAKVVIAIKNGIDSIQRQLYERYEINFCVLFNLGEYGYSFIKDDAYKLNDVKEDSCIIKFYGGLGNQMFHYAVLKNLELRGLNVLADLESYKKLGVMEFQLTNVFKNIKLKICSKSHGKVLIEKNLISHGKEKRFLIYSEAGQYEGKIKKADLSIFNITGGIIDGNNQTYIYANMIRKQLLRDFEFDTEVDSKLEILYNNIARKNAVSIHIRRGDYLAERNKRIYEDICTWEYYNKAISYMEEKIERCEFVFFSDDIEWVRKNFIIKNAIYIDSSMFEKYYDWYDMYLMSACKHNIIANSTFSWWGAWLNRNEEKIVIAPKRWINSCEYEDIYPQDWITL